MAASFLALNGTAENDVSSTTLTFTTTRLIQAGEHVVVCGGENSNQCASITVGSLSLASRVSDTSTRDVWIWSAPATADIASGSTVTVTWATAQTFHFAICISLAGVAQSGYIDATMSKVFTSGTALDSGVTAAVAAGGVAVAATDFSNQAGTTATGGYVEQAEINTGSNGGSLQVETLDNVTAGTQNATWTMNTAVTAAGCVIVVFVAEPAMQTVLPDADTVTTGWTTTPLYSKINDSSDATVVTATAA